MATVADGPRFLPTRLPDGYAPTDMLRVTAADLLATRWVLLGDERTATIASVTELFLFTASVPFQGRTETHDEGNYKVNGTPGQYVVYVDLGQCGAAQASGRDRTVEQLIGQLSGLTCEGKRAEVTDTRGLDYLYDGPPPTGPHIAYLFTSTSGERIDLQVQYDIVPAALMNKYLPIIADLAVNIRGTQGSLTKETGSAAVIVRWPPGTDVTAVAIGRSRDGLLAVARSVKPASDAEWERATERAGLRP